MNILKKEAGKKRFATIILALALLISSFNAFAADPGHAAAAISTGMFESRNFRFLEKREVTC